MLLATYLFLMVYGPKIGVWFESIVLVSILLVIRASFVRTLESSQVRRLRLWVTALLAVLFLYSLFVNIINPDFDFYYLLRFGRVFFQFLGGYALMRLYYAKYYDNMADKLLEHLYWAIAAHALIMLLMFVFTPIRSLVLAVLRVTMETRSGPAFLLGKRVGGLTFALDTLSVVQSFGILLFPFVIRRFRGLKRTLAYLALVVTAFSVVISGRTGTIMLILFLPVALFYMRRNVFMIFAKLGLVALLLGVLLAILRPGEDVQYRFEYQIERLTGALTSYEQGGEGLQEGVTGKLIDDYRTDWPKDIGVFVYGNARSSRPVDSPYFVSADPGYILDVYGIGIIGSVIMLSFYGICLWHALKCFSHHKLLALASLLYTLMILIVNGKVRFALARECFTVSVVLLVATVYLRSLQPAEYYEAAQADLPGVWDEGGDGLLRPADI